MKMMLFSPQGKGKIPACMPEARAAPRPNKENRQESRITIHNANVASTQYAANRMIERQAASTGFRVVRSKTRFSIPARCGAVGLAKGQAQVQAPAGTQQFNIATPKTSPSTSPAAMTRGQAGVDTSIADG